MGLIAKHRKQYVSHKKRWDKNTIEEEAKLVTDYAFKNKKEIRKVELQLSNIKKLAKFFNSSHERRTGSKAQAFVANLKDMGIIAQDVESLDQVLGTTLRDIMERRLSNLVYKKGLARTPKQARQFVVHGHVRVHGKVVNAPSYQVSLEEQDSIEFIESSALASEEHPERSTEVTKQTTTVEMQEEAPAEEEKAEEKTEEAQEEKKEAEE